MPPSTQKDPVHVVLNPPGWKWHASDPRARLGLPALLQKHLTGCDSKCNMTTEAGFEDIAVWQEPDPRPAASAEPEEPESGPAAQPAAPEWSYPTLLGRTRSAEAAKPVRDLGKHDVGVQVCSDDLPPVRPAALGPPASRRGCSPERAWAPPTGSTQLPGARQAGLDVLEVLQLQDAGGAEAEWRVAERVPPLLLPRAEEAERLLGAARGRVGAEQGAQEEDAARSASPGGSAAKCALLKGLRSGRVARIMDAAEAAEGLAATARGGCLLPPVPPSARDAAAPAATAHTEWELAMEWHSLERALNGSAGTRAGDKIGH